MVLEVSVAVHQLPLSRNSYYAGEEEAVFFGDRQGG